MDAEIKWKRKGGLFISPTIAKEWMIRVPTVRHRLSRSGTVALTPPERYDLQEKKGILLVDSTLKSYVFIPKTLLDQYPVEMKDCNGVKASLAVYDVKKIIGDHSLPLVKIPDESTYRPAHELGVAGDIRKRFGL